MGNKTFGSYRPGDVEILLKDITGLVQPLPTQERERLNQSGVHYSEMLPLEYEPSPEYLQAYYQAVERYGQLTADAVCSLAEKIIRQKGQAVVLVSLARAGTPIGILLKHCIRRRFSIDVPHYTVSIIRGKGIDKNAMSYILARHAAAEIQFVDGWTGKGAIQTQLNKAMEAYPQVSPGLAVLSDPANVAALCGTHEDILIASSLLNSTVSGLLSRTFCRNDIIGPEDFHGAVFYRELAGKDLTYHFIDSIEERFSFQRTCGEEQPRPAGAGIEEVKQICQRFGIGDVNLVKPGLGEATRVLLRRVPWKILVYSMEDYAHLGHIYQLAKEKQVELCPYQLQHYKACGIIKKIADA